MQFNFEFEKRISAGFIGAGGHSYRNIYPCFQYAPVDLVAVCDHHPEKASAYARLFGAPRWYVDHTEMLEKEQLDAVFISVGFDPQGRPRYPALAVEAMRAGCHVWMEKPPASGTPEVRQMQGVSAETGKFVLVAFKKCFTPAHAKAKEIIARSEFGGATSVYYRYPLSLPPLSERTNPTRFRDIVHPASALLYLMGPLASLMYEQHATSGGVAATLRFRSGAIGVLHLTAGQGGGPLERLEIIGAGANVVVDNGMRLLYHRARPALAYGRSPDYYVGDEAAALVWEPEFSLGQLYNKALFLMGYVQQVDYFARCVLENRPPQVCGLADALEIMKWHEGFVDHPPRTVVSIPEG